MSHIARVIRQFRDGTEAVTLERTLPLPAVPTMGSRLNLRAQGVEAALEGGLRKNPSLPTLKKLAKALGVPVAELLL